MSTDFSHHGILGQKWGARRYQNSDGSLTEEGKKRYNENDKFEMFLAKKADYDEAVTDTKGNNKWSAILGLSMGVAVSLGALDMIGADSLDSHNALIAAGAGLATASLVTIGGIAAGKLQSKKIRKINEEKNLKEDMLLKARRETHDPRIDGMLFSNRFHKTTIDPDLWKEYYPNDSFEKEGNEVLKSTGRRPMS